MRVLELFSGLGGWRYALGDAGTIVAAYDISPPANATYRFNHGDRPHARELASVPAEKLAAWKADLWVMSPPCQPFCRMGNQHGLEDRRSAAFLRLLGILPLTPPTHLALENVLGFAGSDAHARLEAILEQLGFAVAMFQLCATQFGIPNQRPRCYLLASRRPLHPAEPPTLPPGAIAPFLDEAEDPSLYLDDRTLAKHGPGLDVVTSEDRRTTCFIGGYGQRFVGSGSFLRTTRGIRRFSPAEIARFMGLPADFGFPAEIPFEQRYKLLGNGLNITVARWVLQQLSGA